MGTIREKKVVGASLVFLLCILNWIASSKSWECSLLLKNAMIGLEEVTLARNLSTTLSGEIKPKKFFEEGKNAKSERNRTLSKATVEFCRLESLSEISRIHQRKKSYPLLSSLIPVDGRYKVIMMLRHLNRFNFGVGHTNGWGWTEDYVAWFCDNELAETQNVTQFGGTLVFSCPLDVSIIRGKRRKGEVEVSFHVDLWKKCDDDIIMTYYGIPQGTDLMACTMVKNNNFELNQWVEYHRMIGYDHFLVYVNESFNTSAVLDVPYITYIPWGFEPFEEMGKAGFVPHQHAHIMDCLQRTKVRNITWVAFHDIDEYFQVMDRSLSLKDILIGHLNDTYMSGLQLKSWFWGDYNASVQPHHKFMLESTWRSRVPFVGKLGREKMITRPRNMVYFNLHSTALESAGPMRTDSRIRLNHYKRRDQGVSFATEGIVEDTSFRDDFLEKIKERMEELELHEISQST